MAYLSLNLYKKVLEMKKEGKTDKEIRTELDLTAWQMVKINATLKAYDDQKRTDP